MKNSRNIAALHRVGQLRRHVFEKVNQMQMQRKFSSMKIPAIK